MLDRIVAALERTTDRAADAAQPGLRRIEGRASVGAQGTWTAARRRFRQRLRADRDQFDDRGAHARRPPRRARRVRRGGRPAARFGRPAGARHRGADPRRRRHRARPGRDRRAVRPRRAGVGHATPRSVRCSTPRAGSPPRTSPCSTTSGYLFIGGRSDDTIIRGGENIAPAEIEDVLVEHPARARLRRRRRRGSRVGPDHRRRRGARRRAPTPIPTNCASTSASSCADPAPPTGWSSATNCPPTRPARCCAANSSAS